MANLSFNPIKEEVGGQKIASVVWTTKMLNVAADGLKHGKLLKVNPFFDGKNLQLLKSNLVFKRTDEETKEWLRCRDNLVYFAKNYCKLLTPTGVHLVDLRDYQIKYLKHLQEHRLSIYLSCRQSSKCVSFDTLVDVLIDGQERTIPIFELYNIFNKSKTTSDDQEYALYKYYIKTHDEKVFGQLASVDRQCDQEDKFVNSCLVDGVKIKTSEGWSPAAYVHKTKPYNIYYIKTETGRELRCADDHLLYVNDRDTEYVKNLHAGDVVATATGPEKIIEYNIIQESVCMYDVTVLNEKEDYYSGGLLSHNTTTSAIFLLHYALFNADKNILVLGNKGKTAREILRKLKDIFLNVPFYLKPGVDKWNESGVTLDNGCMILAENTTVNSGISYTFHCILADEFAKVPRNIQDPFYNNLFPTITSSRARFIISSTQNDWGPDKFYEIYTDAVNGDNSYTPFVTNWWEVPEWSPELQKFIPRDETWYKQMVGDLGGVEKFEIQFGTSFTIGINSLIASKCLLENKRKEEKYVSKELPGLLYSDSWFWKPDYDPVEELKKDWFLITCDLAEGVSGDYTIFKLNKLIRTSVEDEIHYRAVGYFRCNTLDQKTAARCLYDFCNTYLDTSKYIISIEWNTYGALFVEKLIGWMDKEDSVNFTRDNFVKYWNEGGTKYTYGVRLSHQKKQTFCQQFKEDYEGGLIEDYSTIFLSEAERFIDKTGSGTWASSYGHDDYMMASVQAEACKSNFQMKNFIEDFLSATPYIGPLGEGDSTSNADLYNASDVTAVRPLRNIFMEGRFRLSDKMPEQNPWDAPNSGGGGGTIWDF